MFMVRLFGHAQGWTLASASVAKASHLVAAQAWLEAGRIFLVFGLDVFVFSGSGLSSNLASFWRFRLSRSQCFGAFLLGCELLKKRHAIGILDLHARH